jgi:putative peptide zinc metalloprotease protein
MISANPKLRDDLVISQQKTKEGTGFVVKDPATGRFFRLKEVEHFFARNLNGSTPLDAIRKSVENKFGVTFTADSSEQFIQTLGRLGLLEKEGADSGSVADRPRTIRGSLLYLRFKAFDPDRLFNRLVSKLSFFFTPHFIVFSAAIILLAIGITATNWEEIGRGIQSLYHLQALLFAWIVIFLVITAHEFAHGLACKHFGGEVHEVGFMLLHLLTPRILVHGVRRLALSVKNHTTVGDLRWRLF